MKDDEIKKFVIENVDPVPLSEIVPSEPDYQTYRCSAYLTDGVYLPCVLVVGSRALDETVIPQLEKVRAQEKQLEFSGYSGPGPLFTMATLVRQLVMKGNRLSAKAVARTEVSPYSIPRSLRADIQAETSTGWTQFTGVMNDGARFEFGSEWNTIFFDMPKGYMAKDLVEVIPAKPGHRSQPEDLIYRERPHFVCIIDGL